MYVCNEIKFSCELNTTFGWVQAVEYIRSASSILAEPVEHSQAFDFCNVRDTCKQS
jgi:hypothetical protein